MLYSQESVKEILGAMPGDYFAFEIKEDGRVLSLCETAGIPALLGHTAASYRDIPDLMELVWQQDRPMVAEKVHAGLTAPQCYRFRAQRRDGELSWVQLCTAALPLEDGRVVQIANVTDVTRDVQKDEDLENTIRRFNLALDRSDLMIWEYDMVGHRCINSEKAGRDYAIPLVIENYPESLFTTGFVPPETIEQILDVKKRLENGETGFSVERRTIDNNGVSHWQKVDYTLICDEAGHPVRAIVCGQDITAHKELERKYREQLEYRNSLADNTMFSSRLDLDDDTMMDATCGDDRLACLTEKDNLTATQFLSGFFSTSLFNPKSEITKERLMPEALKTGYIRGQTQYQTMYQCSLLNKFIEMSLSLTKSPDTGHLEAFLFVQDVTQNAFLHDGLTGLYNRQRTFLECSRLLQEHPQDTLVLARFDLQKFRLYNTFFGEAEGDRLLQYIADLLRGLSKTHKYGVYGRIEADVFLMLFPMVEGVIERNTAIIRESLARYRSDYPITGNCGIYFYRDRAMPVEAAFNRAALAAKSGTGSREDRVRIFSDEMELALQREQRIQKQMKTAVEQGEFQVYIQPKYRLDSQTVCGGEALVRWAHPKQGLIYPNSFIPLFESNGFITTLDRYMWEQVCRLLRRWLDEGKNPAPISVNMSRLSMYSRDTVEYLGNLVEKYGLSTQMLQLELTESAYMGDPQTMKQRLEELHHRGFCILMDDFGSGYSSLNTLREIPVDYIKVDRGFLASIEQDDRSRTVLKSVVKMAADMGIPVITEGIENLWQQEFLQNVGCEYGQGFLFAKPMPALEYETRYLSH